MGEEGMGVKMVNDPILITGCARSGTSITAGIVHYCGAWIGDVTGRTRYNQKGQFENRYIRDQVVKPALRNADVDPLGQWPLPDPATWKIDERWRRRIVLAMIDQGYKGGPWAYKGAKMCLFWPQWVDAFPNAKWIIVRRDDAEVINSCQKTAFMKAFKNAKGWQKWIDIHKQRFNEMREAGLDIVEVWPVKVINGQFGEMKNVIQHIGLKWNRDIVHDFIEPRLWHKVKDKPVINELEVANG